MGDRNAGKVWYKPSFLQFLDKNVFTRCYNDLLRRENDECVLRQKKEKHMKRAEKKRSQNSSYVIDVEIYNFQFNFEFLTRCMLVSA